MRVLLVAPRDGHSHLYIREAFQELGHQVQEFDYRNSNALLGWAGMSLQLRNLNKNCDFTLILKGESILPEVIRELKNCALWNFDAWYSMSPELVNGAKAARWFFTPSKGLLKEYGEMGINSFYLCEAASRQHAPCAIIPDSFKSDIAFIGTIENVAEREQWLTEVARAFPYRMKLWGSFGGRVPNAVHLGRPVYGNGGEDYGHNLVVSGSKITLDKSRTPEIEGAFSARIFRTLAAKGFLLMRKVQGIEAMFQPGVDLDVFETTQECIEKIRFYLDDEEARKIIAENGCRKVLASHTFVKRIEEMLMITDLGK